MSDVDDLQVLADPGEVQCPQDDSAGTDFLRQVADEALDCLEEMAYRFQVEEIASIADGSLCTPDDSHWDVFVDLQLWREDVAELVPPKAGMTWSCEKAAGLATVHLAAALVAASMTAAASFVI